jgi:cell division cycle 2-like protein
LQSIQAETNPPIEEGEIAESDGPSLNGKRQDDIEKALREKALNQLRAQKPELSQPDDAESDGSPPSIPEAPSPEPQTEELPAFLSACRNVDEAFDGQIRIDEGAYGVVFQATDSRTGEKVALKRVKLTKEREGFPITALREVTILLRLKHPNIINVREVVLDRSMQKVYMAMDYAEHDLKGLMEVMRHPFSQSEVKSLMQQLLSAVDYMHEQWIVHRDLKLSNLLYTNRGELKVCDFGLARSYGDPLRNMTSLVVTLWYRAPELLLGCTPLAPHSGPQYRYSVPIDMWSCGCIFAEILVDEPLFPGKGEHNQLDLIFKLLGTPKEESWPGWSQLPGAKIQWKAHPKNNLRSKFKNPAKGFAGGDGGGVLTDAGYDLMMGMFTYNPENRITARKALQHKYFKDYPPPADRDLMPRYPATQDANKKKRRRERTPELVKNDDQDDEARYATNTDRNYTLPTENQRGLKDQLLRQLAAMDKARK